jgi:hypothetical protein
MLIELIPIQGKSVLRPAGSSRIPSAAVKREAEPELPQWTETTRTVADDAGETVSRPLGLATPPSAAVIPAVPVAAPVATPEELIVATFGFEEAHVTWLVRFCVDWSVYVPVAVKGWVWPLVMFALAGVIAIETSVAGVTLSTVEPVMLPIVAEIVLVPVPTASVRPCAPAAFDIEATPLTAEPQVTWLVRLWVVPSA